MPGVDLYATGALAPPDDPVAGGAGVDLFAVGALTPLADVGPTGNGVDLYAVGALTPPTIDPTTIGALFHLDDTGTLDGAFEVWHFADGTRTRLA